MEIVFGKFSKLKQKMSSSFDADIDRINAICKKKQGKEAYEEAVRLRTSGPRLAYTTKLNEAVELENSDAIVEWCYFAKQYAEDRFQHPFGRKAARLNDFEKIRRTAEIAVRQGEMIALSICIQLTCELIMSKQITDDAYPITTEIKTVLDSNNDLAKGMLLFYFLHIEDPKDLKFLQFTGEHEIFGYSCPNAIMLITQAVMSKNLIAFESLLHIYETEEMGGNDVFSLLKNLVIGGMRGNPVSYGFYRSNEMTVRHFKHENSADIFRLAQRAVECGSIDIDVYYVLQKFYFDIDNPYYDRRKGMHYLMLYNEYLFSDIDPSHFRNELKSKTAFAERMRSLWAGVFRPIFVAGTRAHLYSGDTFHKCDSDLGQALQELCFYGSRISRPEGSVGSGYFLGVNIASLNFYRYIYSRIHKVVVTFIGIWKFRKGNMRNLSREIIKYLSQMILTTIDSPLEWLDPNDKQIEQIIYALRPFSEPNFHEIVAKNNSEQAEKSNNFSGGEGEVKRRRTGDPQ